MDYSTGSKTPLIIGLTWSKLHWEIVACVATILTFQENEWRKYDVKKYYAIIQEQGMILLPKFATNKQFPWGLEAASDPHLDRLYILHRNSLCLCNQAFLCQSFHNL